MTANVGLSEISKLVKNLISFQETKSNNFYSIVVIPISQKSPPCPTLHSQYNIGTSCSSFTKVHLPELQGLLSQPATTVLKME